MVSAPFAAVHQWLACKLDGSLVTFVQGLLAIWVPGISCLLQGGKADGMMQKAIRLYWTMQRTAAPGPTATAKIPPRPHPTWTASALRLRPKPALMSLSRPASL
jgi:hypothetical protein